MTLFLPEWFRIRRERSGALGPVEVLLILMGALAGWVVLELSGGSAWH